MKRLLKGYKILIGVTGSIAIYKTLDLIRLFIKAGAEVRVIMSEDAKRFVTPLTFEAISQNCVLHSETESWANDNNHIGIGKWADLFIIAPATANTINKLNSGIADNLLLQTSLACNKPKIVAPAANTNMYMHNQTQASFKMLKLLDFRIVEAQNKLLACNEEGIGAMADAQEIFWRSAKELLKDDFWEHRRVVVTGGGTIEKIDDVRYISNFSSGKMAKSLATALYLKGADVCLISTKSFDDIPKEIHFIDVEDSAKMHDFLIDSIRVAKKGTLIKPTFADSSPRLIQKKPFLFMAAAVSDYKPKYPQTGKIKKENIGEAWDLKLEKNIDILSSINKEGLLTVGFKAETNEKSARQNAIKMLEAKKLDAVCLNIIDEDNAFGSDTNAVEFITKKEATKIDKDDKLMVSFKILKFAQKLERA